MLRGLGPAAFDIVDSTGVRLASCRSRHELERHVFELTTVRGAVNLPAEPPSNAEHKRGAGKRVIRALRFTSVWSLYLLVGVAGFVVVVVVMSLAQDLW